MKFHIFFLFCFFIWFLGIGFLIPMTQDEAYYWNWSHHLEFGFFDHPPLVAVLAKLSSFFSLANSFEHDFFHGRLLTSFAACFSFYMAFDFYKELGIKGKDLIKSILLFSTSFAALALGVFTTPDSLQMFFLTLALREAAVAMGGKEKRWLTAGAATGFGLLSKYMLVLVGPIFLLALLLQHKNNQKALFRPWPYLGGLLCFLIFLPHIFWNVQNDFVTFRFQSNHGFSTEHDAYVKNNLFPLAKETVSSDEDYLPIEPFVAYEVEQQKALKMSQTEKEEEIKKDKKPSIFISTLKRFFDFVGGQVALWGLHFFILLSALLAFFRRKQSDLDFLGARKALLLGIAFFPLIFFGSISFFSKVEANWAAMSLIGLAPLVGIYTRFSIKKIALIAGAHFFVWSLIASYTRWPVSFSFMSIDRALKETHGYKELADYIKTQQIPVFAESYQMVSMLRWYGLEEVYQWPHLTRPSYYVFHPEQMKKAFKAYHKSSQFLLLYPQAITFDIEGFDVKEVTKLVDCKEGFYQITSEDLSKHPSCQPIHIWYAAVMMIK